MLAVPLLGSGRVHGVLTAARLSGRPGFTDADVDMAGSFANHAALAIELAEARAQQQLNALLDDRERIAADLHDHVIQRLFASGLTPPQPGGHRRRRAGGRRRPAGRRHPRSGRHHPADPLDHLPAALQPRDPGAGRAGPTARPARRHPSTPSASSPACASPACWRTCRADVVDDLLAVLREALTNVAKHAGASRVEVDLQAADGRLTLQVTDDGRGIDDTGRRSGLANLRGRAENRGGEFTFASTQPHGTRLSWSVPVG